MRKKPIFSVVGHAIMDTRAYLEKFPKEDGMEILERPIVNSPGGSAANLSYNLAKLGFRVKLSAAIGRDSVGEFILNSLKKARVTFYARKFDGYSGRAIVLVDKKGNVKILESLGVADNYFSPKERDFGEHLHITGTSLKVMLSYSKKAKALGLSISCDLGRAKIKLGKRIFPILKRANILFLNRKELAELMKSFGEELDIEKTKEVLEAAKKIRKEFNTIVVVKGGAKEAVVVGEREIVKKPLKVKVVDTIGAGDAFDSGFLGEYVMHKDERKALSFALKLASIKVQLLGAQALPSKRTIRKLIKKLEMG